MTPLLRRTLFVGFSLLAAQGVLFAQQSDIPLHNWTVPPYTLSSSGGITTMTDATPPRLFIGVQPCRLVDTRAGSGFPLGFGAPSLTPGVPRNFDLDNGPCPGLPAGIDAYSLNVTVVNTAGPGHLVIYPQGGLQPDVSTVNYVGGQTIANAAIVPAGMDGGVTVVAGVSGTNLLIDINGYFSDTLGTPSNTFFLVTNSDLPTISASNNSTTCGGPCGIYAATNSGSAVWGVAEETTSDQTSGVLGQSNSTSLFSAGVRGFGVYKGVYGSSSSLLDAAGVFGVGGSTPGIAFLLDEAGVRGQTGAALWNRRYRPQQESRRQWGIAERRGGPRCGRIPGHDLWRRPRY